MSSASGDDEADTPSGVDRLDPSGGRVERPPSGAVAREALTHLDSLHRFACSLAGRTAEAEDLVQDTYARALGAESSFTPGTNLRAWLFRILRNVFLDGRRRAKAAPFAGGASSDAGEDQASERAFAPREPLRGDAEIEALRGVVAGEIERALAVLSDDARAVVLLDLEGLTEGEIAQALGCAPGTVKSRLSRARAVLRERLRAFER